MSEEEIERPRRKSRGDGPSDQVAGAVERTLKDLGDRRRIRKTVGPGPEKDQSHKETGPEGDLERAESKEQQPGSDEGGPEDETDLPRKLAEPEPNEVELPVNRSIAVTQPPTPTFVVQAHPVQSPDLALLLDHERRMAKLALVARKVDLDERETTLTERKVEEAAKAAQFSRDEHRERRLHREKKELLAIEHAQGQERRETHLRMVGSVLCISAGTGLAVLGTAGMMPWFLIGGGIYCFADTYVKSWLSRMLPGTSEEGANGN